LRQIARGAFPPDFPKEGILFYDITTLLKDPSAFRKAIDALAEKLDGRDYDLVLGVESRGFIFAATLAYKLGKGLVVIRKPGKLPADTIQATYELEYGTDTVEMHADAVEPGQKVVIVDESSTTCWPREGPPKRRRSSSKRPAARSR
jgi:adenine phosphoribosyltransferase